MRLVAYAVAGFVVLGTGVASAQPMWGPRYEYGGPLTPPQVFRVVQSIGLDPIGPPVRRGPFFVQRASDAYGRAMRVTLDAERGGVVSVRPADAPPYYGPAAEAPYGRQPYAAYDPGPRVLDDDDYGAPVRALPPPYPRVVTPSLPPVPRERSATVTPTTPAKPPLPRKRPEGAEAAKKTEAGTVAPVRAAPQNPAPPSATPQGAPAAKPDTLPINPLY